MKKDKHNYKGFLNSDNMFKRIAGVIGYFILGYLMLVVAVLSFAFVVGLIIGIFS